MKNKNDSGRKAVVKAVRDIQDPAVIELLRSENLSVERAKALCKEIDFDDKNGLSYRGYGFQNIAGGYSMIALSKGSYNVGPVEVAVIRGDGTDPSSCLLFAGLRDVIAHQTLYGPSHCDAIVMFSTSFANRAAKYITANGYSQIFYFSPNSEGRKMSMPVLAKTGIMIWDMSLDYAPFKDLRKYCAARKQEANIGTPKKGKS